MKSVQSATLNSRTLQCCAVKRGRRTRSGRATDACGGIRTRTRDVSRARRAVVHVQGARVRVQGGARIRVLACNLRVVIAKSTLVSFFSIDDASWRRRTSSRATTHVFTDPTNWAPLPCAALDAMRPCGDARMHTSRSFRVNDGDEVTIDVEAISPRAHETSTGVRVKTSSKRRLASFAYSF